MCEDEERVTFFPGSFKKLKKSKKSDFICHEIYTSYGHDVSFYHVWLEDVEYLLDSQWRLVDLPKPSTLFWGDFEDLFVVQKNTCDNYPCFEDISKAKKTLPPSLFNALSKAYIKGLLDYVEFNRLPEKGYPYKDGTAENLIMHYDKCNSTQNREACVKILFDYLKITKGNVFLSTKGTASIYLNDIVKILTWKDLLKWNFHIFYSKLQGGEDRLLFMLACARKRKAGNNFFAQFPKDVMFGILFPILKWSLPYIFFD